MFFSSHPGVGWNYRFLPLPGFQSRLLSHSAAAAEKLYHPRTARYANDALQQRSSKSRSVLATSNPIHRPQKKTSPTYLLQNQRHPALVFCTNASLSKKRWKFESFPVPILRSALGFVNQPTHCLDTFYDVEGIYLSHVWPVTSDQGNQKGIFDM